MKLQQRIENKWYWWHWQDSFLWIDWQFQYWQNINIHNELKGFQLNTLEEVSNNTTRIYIKVFQNWMIRIRDNWDVYTTNNALRPTEVFVWATTDTKIIEATFFKDDEFVFGEKVQRITDLSPFTITDITPPAVWSFPWWTTLINSTDFIGWVSVLNYRNTLLVVWIKNYLLTYDPVLWWTAGRKVVREFWQWQVVWITTVWNNIAVRLNYNWLDSRVFYLNWTFDVEDNGVINTVPFEWLSIRKVVQMWNSSFALCKDLIDGYSSSFYEISWYDKRIIKKSTDNFWNTNYPNVFVVWNSYQVYWNDWDSVYMPMEDWIWSYWKKSSLVDNCINLEWSNDLTWITHKTYLNSCVFGRYLYVAYLENGVRKEWRYYIWYKNKQWYTNKTWIMISRVYTWILQRKFKTPYELNISYQLDKLSANPWQIKVYLRHNRPAYNYTDWRELVATITDNTKMAYKVIASQTAILRDFNCLEYKVELIRWSDATVSPIFYELHLVYEELDKQN